eukprot:6214648-Pleurochrysis_carterae.AAC.3
MTLLVVARRTGSSSQTVPTLPFASKHRVDLVPLLNVQRRQRAELSARWPPLRRNNHHEHEPERHSQHDGEVVDHGAVHGPKVAFEAKSGVGREEALAEGRAEREHRRPEQVDAEARDDEPAVLPKAA